MCCSGGLRDTNLVRRFKRRRSVAQRLQYPLIKEYSLNYSRIPNMVKGIFLKEGILESLGVPIAKAQIRSSSERFGACAII